MLYTRMYCLNGFFNTRGSESHIFCVMNREKKMAGDEDEVPLRDYYLTYRVYRIIILQSARVWHVVNEKGSW